MKAVFSKNTVGSGFNIHARFTFWGILAWKQKKAKSSGSPSSPGSPGSPGSPSSPGNFEQFWTIRHTPGDWKSFSVLLFVVLEFYSNQGIIEVIWNTSISLQKRGQGEGRNFHISQYFKTFPSSYQNCQKFAYFTNSPVSLLNISKRDMIWLEKA